MTLLVWGSLGWGLVRGSELIGKKVERNAGNPATFHPAPSTTHTTGKGNPSSQAPKQWAIWLWTQTSKALSQNKPFLFESNYLKCFITAGGDWVVQCVPRTAPLRLPGNVGEESLRGKGLLNSSMTNLILHSDLQRALDISVWAWIHHILCDAPSLKS